MNRRKKTPTHGYKLLGFVMRHKIWTVVIFLATVALVLTAVDYYHIYEAYKKRLTEKDFVAISQMAEDVINKVAETEIIKSEECSYERPEVYSDLHLYCRISAVAYLPYTSNENAARIAKQLESEIMRRGQTFSYLSEFYADPADNVRSADVNLAPPLPEVQCHFTVASDKKAQRIVLPERSEDDLLVIAFDCSAQSRGEYFPVTYRQG